MGGREAVNGRGGYFGRNLDAFELRLARCHPIDRPWVAAELADARAGIGPTVFDWLLEISEDRAPRAVRLA